MVPVPPFLSETTPTQRSDETHDRDVTSSISREGPPGEGRGVESELVLQGVETGEVHPLWPGPEGISALVTTQFPVVPVVETQCQFDHSSSVWVRLSRMTGTEDRGSTSRGDYDVVQGVQNGKSQSFSSQPL